MLKEVGKLGLVALGVTAMIYNKDGILLASIVGGIASIVGYQVGKSKTEKATE